MLGVVNSYVVRLEAQERREGSGGTVSDTVWDDISREHFELALSRHFYVLGVY